MHSKLLNRANTTILRGALMIIIMLHHIFNATGYPEKPQIFSYLMYFSGFVCTSIFFFLSGYGNWHSLEKKPDSSWITKRLKPLYQVFVPCFILSCILTTQSISLGLIARILTLTLPDAINWFPKVIAVCFIVDYIISKINSKNIRILLLFALTVTYISVCIANQLPAYWYNSVASFFVGSAIAAYGIPEAKAPKSIIMCLASLIVAVTLILYFGNNTFIQIAVGIIASISAMFLTAIRLPNFNVISFIGKNSFEFYIVHVTIYKHLTFITNKWIYSITLFLATYAFVFIYSNLRSISSR